jgi:5'-3' exonuclease
MNATPRGRLCTVAGPWAVPVLLLDTASLYYRAYFALPESLVSPEGIPVNAVRGTLDTVASIVSARGSAPVIACWDDDWRPQWRVDLIPSYKTHRVALEDAGQAEGTGEAEAAVEEEVPDTLAPQVDLLRQLLPALGIPVVGAAEAEADDVIADLAAAYSGRVDIASGDRDLVQLVDHRVTLLFTGGSSASRGGKPWLSLDPEAALARFGVPADRYADLAILRGDPSDGLPGAPGIGDKTAAALVNAFGDLTSILAAAEDPAVGRPMTPAVRRRIQESRDDLLAAERVVRLTPRPGRSDFVWPGGPPDLDAPQQGMALAAAWGVEAPARRLVTALQAVAE